MTRRVSIRCPTCGRQTLRRVKRSVKVKVGRGHVLVPGVPLEECSHCGERLYALAALEQIRKAREVATRHTAA